MNVPENTRRVTARAKTSAARIWPAPRTRKCQVRHAGWFPLGSLISAGGGVGKQVRQWSERRSSRGAKPPCVHAAGTAHAWYRVRQNSRFSCTAEERTGELLDCLSPQWIVQVTGENLSLIKILAWITTEIVWPEWSQTLWSCCLTFLNSPTKVLSKRLNRQSLYLRPCYKILSHLFTAFRWNTGYEVPAWSSWKAGRKKASGAVAVMWHFSITRLLNSSLLIFSRLKNDWLPPQCGRSLQSKALQGTTIQ